MSSDIDDTIKRLVKLCLEFITTALYYNLKNLLEFIQCWC